MRPVPRNPNETTQIATLIFSSLIFEKNTKLTTPELFLRHACA